MRSGFTTGSCAALCAKAAAIMLFSGIKKENMEISTPGGIKYKAKLYNIEIKEDYALCGVYKDSGDDPDVTKGMFIGVKVCKNTGLHNFETCSVENSDDTGNSSLHNSKINSTENANSSDKIYNNGEYSSLHKISKRVQITAGEGIGIVTRPGLEQPVGSPAINSTPRKMITKEVEEVMDFFSYDGGVIVTVYAPEGKEIAKKTFNPHMGIEGGISILGTTGIVEPMSTKAIVDTIKWDLSVKRAEKMDTAIICPGNYGVNFLKENYGYLEKDIVTCSNFIGDALTLSKEAGFKKILFCGHIGKLIKVYGGEMYTHSAKVDRRMELMEKAAEVKEGTYKECVTTTAVLDILDKEGRVKEVSEKILDGILYYMKKHIDDESIELKCILYESKYGLLSTNFHR